MDIDRWIFSCNPGREKLLSTSFELVEKVPGGTFPRRLELFTPPGCFQVTPTMTFPRVVFSSTVSGPHYWLCGSPVWPHKGYCTHSWKSGASNQSSLFLSPGASVKTRTAVEKTWEWSVLHNRGTFKTRKHRANHSKCSSTVTFWKSWPSYPRWFAAKMFFLSKGPHWVMWWEGFRCPQQGVCN